MSANKCAGQPNSQLRILFVDDDDLMRLIEKNIRRAGVNNPITSFTNGTDAVNYLFGEGKTLLILLGLNLPDMSGTEILKRVKETPGLRCPPVIVLTTTDDKTEIQRCYDLGANVYITKPVNYDNFANAIRQLGLFFAVIQVPA